MARFSVLTPVYNHERYVRQAVTSALRSPLVEEVLLVDDGSRDASASIVAALAAQYPGRVRDLTGKYRENRGAHARLNQLVEAARCEWVAVLNSDDVFINGRFEAVVSQEAFSECEFVFGNLLLMDGQGYFVGAKRGPFDTGTPFPADFVVEEMVRAGNLIDLFAHQNFAGTTSNMLFTRSLHARIGGFADFRYIHDWDFAMRATVVGEALYVRRYLTGYRMHESNTILESAAKVNAEAETLFARLLRDFPYLSNRPGFRLGLRSNVNLPPGWTPGGSVQTATAGPAHS